MVSVFGGFLELGEMIHLRLAPQGGKGSQVPGEVLQSRRGGERIDGRSASLLGLPVEEPVGMRY